MGRKKKSIVWPNDIKICPHCKKEKRGNDFYIAPSRTGASDRFCKDCNTQISRNSRIKKRLKENGSQKLLDEIKHYQEIIAAIETVLTHYNNINHEKKYCPYCSRDNCNFMNQGKNHD